MAQKEAAGLATGGDAMRSRFQPGTEVRPTLAEAGIDKKMADRIQARAIRRAGELLKQLDGRGGDRTKSNGSGTSAPTQAQAASDAGMSERQAKTAVRVANVPEDEFEAALLDPNRI